MEEFVKIKRKDLIEIEIRLHSIAESITEGELPEVVYNNLCIVNDKLLKIDFNAEKTELQKSIR